MEGEKRKVGKLSTKEKTVRKITSKNEGYSQNQGFCCIDVRSYDIEDESGRAMLIKDVTTRSQKMKANLPTGTKQTIVIDARGRSISNRDLKDLYMKAKCALDSDVEIKFIR